MRTPDNGRRVEIYSGTARTLHWLTVGLIAVQVPLGVAMAYRGNVLNVWDGLTNGLYSSHKLLGVILLGVVAIRLAYRILHGAPDDEPTLTTWQRELSALNHWWMYGLLVAVPLLGWFGVSLYPALDIFGLFSLPALTAPDQATSAVVLRIHAIAALALVGLIAVHVAAALFHGFIRRDNVLWRMLPRRDDR